MVKLNGKDVDRVFNLMQRYPASVKTGDDTMRFFQETQKIFDSDELVFLYPNNRTSGVDLKRSFVLQQNSSYMSRYAEYYWQYDPLFNAELNTEHDVLAFRTQDVIPYKHLVKLKYYDDFLQPQNLFSELVIRLFFKSFFLGAISLLRSKNKPVFDRKDIRKAEMLIPYIVNTIDVGEIFFRGFEKQKLFEQWLETQAEGIILLDAGFRALYHNSRADLFCLLLTGRKNPAAGENDIGSIAMPDVIIQDCQCLVRSSRGKTSIGYDNRIINLPNQKRYHLQYFLFHPDEMSNAGPNYIIVINDLTRFGEEIAEIISGQGKLSHREAIVAKYAGMGWTNKEIADSIHSSPFTIQNQLKKIFEKTGLKNRTQLANLMKYSDGINPDN
jgi:DNA-binding CsgD family transcriptional regulator